MGLFRMKDGTFKIGGIIGAVLGAITLLITLLLTMGLPILFWGGVLGLKIAGSLFGTPVPSSFLPMARAIVAVSMLIVGLGFAAILIFAYYFIGVAMDYAAKKWMKVFFMISVAVSNGVTLILVVVGFIKAQQGQSEEGLRLILFGLIPSLFSAWITMVLFYKMWAAIQDGYARTSPGKAIWFSFIPLFNFYWAFQLIWGFSKDYNSYLNRHSINAQRLPEGLFLTYTIINTIIIIADSVMGLGRANVPFQVILLFSIVGYFISLVVVSKICNGMNAILSNSKNAMMQ